MVWQQAARVVAVVEQIVGGAGAVGGCRGHGGDERAVAQQPSSHALPQLQHNNINIIFIISGV